VDRSSVDRLKSVNDFDSLLTYLRDELDWPVDDYGFDDLTFQYTATELGLDEQSAAKVTEIRRLRPLDDEQPWGIFFLELEPKRLPVVALRRLLSKMTLKKRDTANRSDSPAWHADDILFISRMGESDERHLTFAHFAANPEKADLPVLKVLGWDASDTVLRVEHVAEVLKEKLVWPEDPSDSDQWRRQWRDAFTLKHREQITTAKEMASRLAEVARGIRSAIQNVLAVESENGPMTQIMGDFKKSLVHDLDPEQFADTYAQTITYGLLSARITDPSKNTLDDLASHMQTNPFLKELMESFIHVGGRKKSEKGVGLDFDELGVSEVIDVLDNANMEAVVRDFGRTNQQEDPVIHFFEGFLQEYDSTIRKDRGVFYTPRPVVSFIVRSVDELLRTEFGLEDGLADASTWGDMVARIDDLEIPEGATPDQAFIQILDPATGTGTFLVDVIDLIHNTMTAKWQAEGHGKVKIQELWNDYVPEHLLPRLHGYELMMAPYAIAHMKIGLKLYETGYRFESDVRARVYLTNALEPAQDFSDRLAFAIPALAHEAEAVNAVKRDQRFTVVIGNPPYAGVSANMSEDAAALIEAYKYVDGAPLGERKHWLHDDYKKFIRFAQLRIAHSGYGVQAYVTNHGYIDDPTARGMRQNLATSFHSVSILDIHGSLKKRESPPEGHTDQNVFDIEPGVAISFFRRSFDKASTRPVSHCHLWGTREQKYHFLLESSFNGIDWTAASPVTPHYLFIPQDRTLQGEYDSGWSVSEIFRIGSTSVQTSRDAFVTDLDADCLLRRIEELGDSEIEDTVLRSRYKLKDGRNWKLSCARDFIKDAGAHPSSIKRILYRAFDFRNIYFASQLINWPRNEVMKHMSLPNVALLIPRHLSGPNFRHVFCSDQLTEMCVLSTAGREQNYHYPLYQYPDLSEPNSLLNDETAAHPNFTPEFLTALSVNLSLAPVRPHGLPTGISPREIFGSIYATLHSPTYRLRYAPFIGMGFPKTPLPGSLELFRELSQCGEELVSLHLLESQVSSDQLGTLIGSNDFKVEEVSYSDETVWIDKAKTRGFKGVPEEVWNFYIGGYQVCEKWLKDRQAKGGKNPRPGRVLSDEDIEHYQKIVVALSETIRIMAEIDEVIEAHGGWPGAFQTADAGNEPISDVVYTEADEGATQLDMVAEPKDG
jgi:predicted helicase